ncbi:MAG TPA: ATP-binding protein [Anaeromyxobacteraceae bacterium]|nr:ATP-binding protein [Anaeromyxobacteraceae bacterium]
MGVGVDEHPRRGEAAPGERSFLGAAHSARRVAAWREALLHGILIAAVFIPFDFLYPARLAWTLAARGALLAVLAGCWWLLRPPAPRRAGPIVFAGALLAGIITPATVMLSSGTSGSRFGFVLAVPFIVLALLPEVPSVAALAGVSAAATGAIGMLAESRPAPLVAEWLLMATALTGVTAYGSRRLRSFADRARSAERARIEALVQLEESERRRAASERMALVGRLAAGIGHEINNPLSAVKGNLSCALEELEQAGLAPHAREALVEALAATERIAWTTADLRALAHDAGTPLTGCALDAAIRDGLARAATRLRGAKAVVDLEPDLPRVRSDPRLLADAVAHLAAHAAAMRCDRTTVRIAARRVAGGVEVTVDDEGPRIPAHVLATIFEPFAAQGEVRGAGLGLTLPLTREIAERGGGRVEARWHEGGNRYVITLAAWDG